MEYLVSMVWLHEGWIEPIQMDNNRGNKADVGAMKNTPIWMVVSSKLSCVVWLGPHINNNV